MDDDIMKKDHVDIYTKITKNVAQAACSLLLKRIKMAFKSFKKI
jgi:hypothetical protein